MSDFRIRLTNAYEVIVEAKNEKEAEAIILKEIKNDYDYPVKEMDCADGWEIESIESD